VHPDDSGGEELAEKVPKILEIVVRHEETHDEAKLCDMFGDRSRSVA
jgi:hypothetical protein